MYVCVSVASRSTCVNATHSERASVEMCVYVCVSVASRAMCVSVASRGMCVSVASRGMCVCMCKGHPLRKECQVAGCSVKRVAYGGTSQ